MAIFWHHGGPTLSDQLIEAIGFLSEKSRMAKTERKWVRGEYSGALSAQATSTLCLHSRWSVNSRAEQTTCWNWQTNDHHTEWIMTTVTL